MKLAAKSTVIALSFLFALGCAHSSSDSKSSSHHSSRAFQTRSAAASIDSVPLVNQIYAAVTGDFNLPDEKGDNGDTHTDIAYIVDNPNNEEFFELWIYMSEGDIKGNRKLVLANKNFIEKVKSEFVSVGEPTMGLQSFFENYKGSDDAYKAKSDSIIIRTEFLGVGRSAQVIERKLAYRKISGSWKWIVSGVEYTFYDKLTTSGNTCSFNLRTAKYQDKSAADPEALIRLNRKFKNKKVEEFDANLFQELIEICPNYDGNGNLIK